jgi:hypothetical protein
VIWVWGVVMQERLELSDLRVGYSVKIKQDFGGGPMVVGTITELDDAIKNGRSGICYDTFDPSGAVDSRWAYLDQVVAIVSRGVSL